MGAKQKTNKAAKKRFRLTTKGKVMRRQAFIGHLARQKSPKQRRHLRKMTVMGKGDADRYKDFI